VKNKSKKKENRESENIMIYQRLKRFVDFSKCDHPSETCLIDRRRSESTVILVLRIFGTMKIISPAPFIIFVLKSWLYYGFHIQQPSDATYFTVSSIKKLAWFFIVCKLFIIIVKKIVSHETSRDQIKVHALYPFLRIRKF
jgi:hypothetical protein